MSGRKAFLLRIDPKLWDELEKWAADELRSVNGQIEYILARAVEAAGRRTKNKRREKT
ncbi:MAG TPA: DNA-binding protein [Candidatus Limnocylindrales bacterium]|nr:DNA-binding protein [Candidatus Limnocylindrales bacterium]